MAEERPHWREGGIPTRTSIPEGYRRFSTEGLRVVLVWVEAKHRIAISTSHDDIWIA